jgi:hypothetical protein
MSATSCWTRLHTAPQATRRRRDGGAHGACRPPALRSPDDVIRQVTTAEPMSIAELRRAAAVLGCHATSGRMDVLVARVRVAWRLEELAA